MSHARASRMQRWRSIAAESGGGGAQGAAHAGGEESAAPKRAEQTEDGGADDAVCVVCADTPELWAVGACNHRVCAFCAHRMRYLYADKQCVMCKSELAHIVVTPSRHADYAELVPDGDSASAHLPSDKQLGMLYSDRRYAERFKRLRGFECSQCVNSALPDESEVAAVGSHASLAKLRAHVRDAHSLTLCDICVKFRKAYFREQFLFAPSSSTLEHGRVQGSVDSNTSNAEHIKKHIREAHPICKFCRMNFYDSDALYEHLQREHFSCFICERHGILYQYYQDYRRLEQHYRAEHFMCQEPACRGVVFDTALDLQIHHKQNHEGAQPSSSRRQANRIRVNLADLHDPSATSSRRNDISSEERERRRRGFDSSDVVYAGTGDSARTSRETQQPASLQQEHRGHAAQTRGVSERQLPAAASTASGNLSEVQDRTNSVAVGFRILGVPGNDAELRERNRILLDKMRSACDAADFERFRGVSGDFRAGALPAEAYLKEAIAIFGRRDVGSIMSELAALLPDEHTRNALILVAMRELGSAAATDGSSVTHMSTVDTPLASHNDRFAAASASDARDAFPSLGTSGNQFVPRSAWSGESGAPGSLNAAEAFPSLNSVAVSADQNVPTANAETRSSRVRRPESALKHPISSSNASSVLSSDAFPSLQGSSAASGASAAQGDPALRVGAIWGGTAAVRVNGASQKQRKGKTPAAAPDLSFLHLNDQSGGQAGDSSQASAAGSQPVLESDAFPTLQVTRPTRPSAAAAASTAVPSTSSSSGDQTSEGSATRGSAVVLDITELQRQRARARGPNYGKSGLPWDQRKVDRKKDLDSNGSAKR